MNTNPNMGLTSMHFGKSLHAH